MKRLRASDLARMVYTHLQSALFGVVLLTAIVCTHYWYPATLENILARYDFLLLIALVTQLVLIRYKLETKEEFFVICLFHIIGTCMELFKTAVGSWQYPEPNLFRIAGVPLFTGFMYSAIGSYIARSFRLFRVSMEHEPALIHLGLLSAAIYINFFTHHYMYDARYVLIAWSVYLFRTTYIHWHTANANYRTHALLPGIAFGVLIWVAENLGTFGHAWIYPHQATAWTLVHPEKIISWYLLSMISFSLVLMIRSRTVDQHP
jgi:uncharacterized membrane protein YoaT (DUF817 family)